VCDFGKWILILAKPRNNSDRQMIGTSFCVIAPRVKARRGLGNWRNARSATKVREYFFSLPLTKAFVIFTSRRPLGSPPHFAISCARYPPLANSSRIVPLLGDLLEPRSPRSTVFAWWSCQGVGRRAEIPARAYIRESLVWPHTTAPRSWCSGSP
jgi:hypothetical protein